MAKVTQYTQNQLASSVTGNVQFDNTGVNLLSQGVERVLPKIEENIKDRIYPYGTPFEQKKAAHQAQLAAMRSAQEQLITAERAAYVADKVGSADQELTSTLTEVKSKHQNDTDGATVAMQQAAQEVRKRYTQSEPDPLRRAQLDKALSERTASYTDNVLKWTETRQVPIMESRVKGTADKFQTQLSNADLSAAEVGTAIQQYQKDNAPLYGFVHASPEDAQAKMHDATQAGVMQWLQATALNAPNKLEDRIKSVSGGKLIDPTKLGPFVNEQRAIARDVTRTQAATEKQRQLGVQLQAGLEIAQASPTGNPKDAPVSVYDGVLKKYGADLTPEQQIRFTDQRQAAIGNVAKTQKAEAIFNTEIDYAHQFGQNAAHEVGHAANIEALIGKVMDKKNPDRLKVLPQLQNAIDQYQDNYANLQAGVNSITDPAVRKIANFHMVAAKERFGDIVNKLNNSPVGAQTKAAKNALYSQVAPKLTDTDPKKNAIYNYFYQNAFYDFIQKKGYTPEVMTKAAGNPAFARELRTRLHHESYILMRDAGLLK